MITSGDNVTISAIGMQSDALMCLTDKKKCCTGGNKQGEWRFPNGSLPGISSDNRDFYRNRQKQKVLLHRRNNALGPLGCYCCEVATEGDPDARICINMSK